MWRVYVAIASLCVFGGSVSPALAQSTGVEGRTYVSPSYGYRLSWEEAWSVEEASSDGGYDLLHLFRDGSDLYVEGVVAYSGDVTTCLDEEESLLRGSEEVSDVEVIDSESIETGDGVVVGVARIFAFVVQSEEADLALTQRSECRALLPGAGVLVATHIAETDAYTEESSLARAVTSSIIMPGQIENGSEAGRDVESITTAVERDLTTFWQEALPDLDATYTAPAYVTFEEPITTECGDADPGGDGPFYCPSEQIVYLDLIALRDEILPFGPFVLEFTVAHETGHHVQELLELEVCESTCEGGYTNLEFELMADCFGGAWARDASDRGELAGGDVEKAVIAMAAYFGDPPNTPATDPDAHGPGALRTWWFLKGYHEGAATCLTINEAD